MSDSVRLHRRQPTRLPLPWDSPGKNTGVGCHFLLQCMKVKSESEAAQSCPTFSNPMDYSLPGSSIHGIFQARVLDCLLWQNGLEPWKATVANLESLIWSQTGTQRETRHLTFSTTKKKHFIMQEFIIFTVSEGQDSMLIILLLFLFSLFLCCLCACATQTLFILQSSAPL